MWDAGLRIETIYYENGHQKVNTYWSNSDYGSKKGIFLNSIFYFKIQSNKSMNLENLGDFFCYSGLFSTLILAPLVSINYHNSDFNSKRYYHWALAGIAATGLGLAITLTNHPKRIDRLQYKEFPAKNKWLVQYYKK